MNEIKKSLIETAGDMSDSERRVRTKVLQHQQKKQDFKKNIFASITAIAVIALFFVITSFLMNNDQEVTQATIFDEEIFETSLKLQKVLRFSTTEDEEYILQEVYDSYERDAAYYTFALSLGYEITDSEIEQQYQTDINYINQNEEFKKYHQEILKSANITIDEFEDYQLKKAPFNVALKKLEKHYMEKYPKLESFMAGTLAQKNAIPYFRENYADDIREFKENHNLPLYDRPLGGGTKVLGRVVGFEDNMFLLVPGATINDIETMDGNDIVAKYSEGYWVPQDGTPELGKGDMVEVSRRISSTDKVPNVMDIWDFNMIDDYEPNSNKKNTMELTISSDKEWGVRSFVGTLRWEVANFEMSQSADYEFTVKDVTYQVWSHPDGFVLVSSKGEYRKLSVEFTEELSEYLGLN